MMKQLGLLSMSDHEYDSVVKRLERLRPFVQAIPEVGDLLMRLSPNLTDVLDESLTAATKGPATLLKTGNAAYDARHDVFIGRGFRKTASATVMVKEIPVTEAVSLPRFVVNDRPHFEYFLRLADRVKLANVLACSSDVDGGWDAFTRVQVYAKVAGGGASGQAGAVALGLARALALHPGRFQRLDAAGLLTRDARIVERKKPGQEKARKKFTWVKR